MPVDRARMRKFALRVAAMAAKEVLHIRRDPRTLLLALAMPVVMLLIFGYGVSFDLDQIPLAIADGDRTEESRRLADAFVANHEFQAVTGVEAEGAQELFRKGQALAVLVIPRGYADHPVRGEAGQAQLLVDGADAVTANNVLSKADAIARAESQRRATRSMPGATVPLQVKVWTRYNPEARSAVFFVPGLAAYLMAIAAVLLTALTVASEWERGSMEQLFASPVGRLEIILGKLLPYLGLGMLQLLLVIAVGVSVFEVPLLGSPLLLLVAGFLFLVGMLGQGLFISVVTKNQLVATQAGALSSLLPSMLLSGMVVPIENMPVPLQMLSRVIPARYLVHTLRGAMLKGNGLAVLWPDLVALAIFGVLVVALAVARFQRRVA
jgi:ABC-2 type transport system permease protein